MKKMNFSEARWMRISRKKHAMTKKTEDSKLLRTVRRKKTRNSVNFNRLKNKGKKIKRLLLTYHSPPSLSFVTHVVERLVAAKKVYLNPGRKLCMHTSDYSTWYTKVQKQKKSNPLNLLSQYTFSWNVVLKSRKSNLLYAVYSVDMFSLFYRNLFRSRYFGTYV